MSYTPAQHHFGVLNTYHKRAWASAAYDFISTLGTSPIEASRLFKPRPASIPASFTVSPALTIDNGLRCLFSICYFLAYLLT